MTMVRDARVTAPAHNPDDLTASLAGDLDAYARVVDAHAAAVRRTALAMTGDLPASEDIAQETFLAAWRQRETLRDPTLFPAWLRGIARNTARLHLRTNARFRRRHVPWEASAADERDPRPPVDEQLAAREDAQALAEGLAALRADDRELLIAYYREGDSLERVAAQLGVGEAAAKQRLHRARGKLRAETLTRFAEAARRTARKAGTGAAVVAVIATSTPGAAAAATMATSAIASSSLWAKLATAIPMIGLGALSARWKHARAMERAIDDDERRALERMHRATLAVLVMSVLLMQLATHSGVPWLLIGSYVVLMAWTLVLRFVWAPRIAARREAAERAADPSAAARQASARRWRAIRVGMALAVCLAVVVRLAWRTLGSS